ncbi:hypothetical protein M1437_00825 [Patescibacteria group bacterium]|nr:hypothetical protein [Patescibacteria group bacterium]
MGLEVNLGAEIHREAVEFLQGTEIKVAPGGWTRRIVSSVITLGLWPLVADPFLKRLNRDHMSLWERTQARTKESYGIAVQAIGHRPLSESLVCVFLDSNHSMSLTPQKDGSVEGRVHTLNPVNWSWINKEPTLKDFAKYYSAITIAQRIPQLPT